MKTVARRWCLGATVALVLGAGAQAKKILSGSGLGDPPQLGVFEPGGGQFVFPPFDPGFGGGVRVGAGDVTGDGVPDIIVAAGPGGGPRVMVFDGLRKAAVRDFLAYDPGFTGGVFVAAGDVSGDGVADIVTSADAGGGPHVKVFDGTTGLEISSFFAYSAGFAGGVRVAVADIDGDGFAEIVTSPGSGGGSQVKIFSGATGGELTSFFAFSPAFTGGVFVSVGDTDGDGLAEIVTGADSGGGPQVSVFRALTGAPLASFFAYDNSFAGGVRVAVGDYDDDGKDEIITGAGPGGGSSVKVFQGTDLSLLASYDAFSPTATGGVFVAGSSVLATAAPEPGSGALLGLLGLLVAASRRLRASSSR